MEFERFPKLHRYSRECIITEKIDGTNAQVLIHPVSMGEVHYQETPLTIVGDYAIWAGSRTRWLYPGRDNFGFAGWVAEHAEELVTTLGIGRHYGEWWGSGIQRGYGLGHKRFSLFNTTRWEDLKSDLVHVVPVVAKGNFGDKIVYDALSFLERGGSLAAPGFMKPEGIVVYHVQGGVLFKKTIDNDDKGKEHNA